jgi:transposase, IS5 family
MREQRQKQMNLAPEWLSYDRAQELEAIAGLLEANPTAVVLVWQDLVAAGLASGIQQRGAEGLSASQVLRALILKQLNSFSYRQLEFHLGDSQTYRRFCELGWNQAASKSALASSIKAIRAETLEAINLLLVQTAKQLKIEDGKRIRADTTVVDSNIHPPLDSNLLWDSVRVLTRLMAEAQEVLGQDVHFGNRTRRAKRRALGILNAKTNAKREPLYRDLLKVAKETIESADEVTKVIDRVTKQGAMDVLTMISLRAIGAQIAHYIPLARRVVDQAQRRVLEGETVPSGEKLVSIFEEHTDIIIKDRRDTYFGHKICLTTGRSTLVTDCVILQGNPADSTLAEQVIDRHIAIMGQAPKQVAFDGGFTSKPNLDALKAKGVVDVSFSKAQYLSVLEMVRSSGVYKKLRNFRAGIEATISFLKRSFGLDRCTWRSLPSFKSYVWSSIVTFNLLVIARHLLA